MAGGNGIPASGNYHKHHTTTMPSNHRTNETLAPACADLHEIKSLRCARTAKEITAIWNYRDQDLNLTGAREKIAEIVEIHRRQPIRDEAAQSIEDARRRSIFLKNKYEALPEDEKMRRAQRLENIFKETIGRLPQDVRQTLLQYWQSHEVVIDGMSRRSPVLKLDRWFTTASSREGYPASAMINREGTIFTFDYGLLFAPEEALIEACAHELAHAYSIASPQSKSTSAISKEISEIYHESARLEEQAVHDYLSKWGMPDGILVMWEVAVEEGMENWKQLYRKMKKRAKSRIPMPPAR